MNRIHGIPKTTDWTCQCEAVSRKTNRQCPHRANTLIPSIISAHHAWDEKMYAVYGPSVYLCPTHSRSFNIRKKRLLSLKLIDGGYLSAYNKYAYGSIITSQERLDFSGEEVWVKLSPNWPACHKIGRVPPDILKLLFPGEPE